MNKTVQWRIWIYYRLSRDDDKEMNSLKNQKQILMDYIERNGYQFAGESFDDNVSGMTFVREGIEEIYKAAAERKMDVVLVKDLSRFGREKIQTAMFIEYLRSHNVRVISVTDNTDSFNEDDEFRMDMNQFINHMYARDVSKKVRAGYRQKQKDKGVCNMPPMGYYKDKLKDELVIMDEPAEIVREIYTMYLDGYGFKSIAEKLNKNGKKSPSYYQKVYNNKNQGYNKPAITFRYLWDPTAVKRVLTNEFYTGTLVCHVEETDKAKKIRKKVPKEEQFRHENYAPVIIPKEVWDKVQKLIESKKEMNIRASSGNPYHRYTGLLKCGDCGCTFVAKIRKWKDKPERIEYVCNGYHRYKGYCTSHRVQEKDLDALVYKELSRLKSKAQGNWLAIEDEVKKRLSNKGNVDKKIKDYRAMIENLELEQENILIERIRDMQNRAAYDRILEKRKVEIENLKTKIQDIMNMEQTVKKRKKEIKESIDILDGIISEGAISNVNLRLLVKEIIVLEDEVNKIALVIVMNAPFSGYGEIFDNDGNVILAHNGDYKPIPLEKLKN